MVGMILCVNFPSQCFPIIASKIPYFGTCGVRFHNWFIVFKLFENKCFYFRMTFKTMNQFSSAQFTQSCQTLCDPMNRSTPGLPIHHQRPESTPNHVHWVGDAIQPSHLLSFPSPSAFNLPQHQDLFKRVSSSYQVAKVLEFQLQHQSFQRTPRTDFL